MQDKLPEFLYKMLINEYEENDVKRIIEGYSYKRPITIRANTLKTNADDVKRKLDEAKIKYEDVTWWENAFVIENEKSKIENLEMYQNGEIYMQSLSSMIPPIILEPKEEENILDMAAAPGGKTTEISMITNGNSYITACEKNKIRADRLKYNLDKQGAKGVGVLVEDARKLNNFLSFDRILLDAPCSGSGTLFIDDENLQKYFNKDLVERSSKLQFDLLKKAVQILKPGHEMIYSTCSILKEENEENVKKILNTNKVEIVKIEDKIFNEVPQLPVTIDGTKCICPSRLYEGFYIAKLRKKIGR